MKYSGLILNDITAADGLCVSFFTQGCPHRCPHCHNPETWDFEGGLDFTPEVMKTIINGLNDKGIKRSLCIMGGEPLCKENAFLVGLIISEVKNHLPDTEIYVWTGYTIEELENHTIHQTIPYILNNIDYLIDGPYIHELRDITLKMRGSSNQRIINMKERRKEND